MMQRSPYKLGTLIKNYNPQICNKKCKVKAFYGKQLLRYKTVDEWLSYRTSANLNVPKL